MEILDELDYKKLNSKYNKYFYVNLKYIDNKIVGAVLVDRD